MATEIIMPKFGFTQETAVIVQWLKKEGDPVEAGDPIAEVTTDKVNMEVEATASGTLGGFRYQQGDTVPVTEVIAFILGPGETAPGRAAAAPGAERTGAAPESQLSAEPRAQVKVSPVAEQIARENGVDLSHVPGSGPGGRVVRSDVETYIKDHAATDGKVRATPAARRIASEVSADLRQITGTGIRGRIQGEDVRLWTQRAAPAAQPIIRAPEPSAAPSPARGEPTHPPAGEPTVVPLSNIRRLIGERLQRSAQEAPHIYLEADIDASSLEDLRRRGNARLSETQPRISLTTILLRMAAWALGRNPMLNSRLDGDKLLLLPEANIGVAVAIDSGLIVPVIRNVERKSLIQLAVELDDLAARARQNRLLPDDVADGTFTISNLGMFGVDRFTAILNPPQAGILAIGRTHKVFVPDENDQPVVRPMMTVTLGADHRVVDGAIAARFLADLRDCAEHPELLAL